MPRQVVVHAPGKLNLALSVGPPDDDGMHPVCSWIVTIDYGDELTVTRLADDRMSRYAILWHREARRRSEIDWPIRRDLAVRAHLALERQTGRKLPVQLKLEKRLPVGGGLGGGSSDAAAMLRAVNHLFELALSAESLRRIGASIGSDVPFFIEGGSAIVEGKGERIEHQESTPEIHAVVVLPDFACPTGRVYEAYDRNNAPPPRTQHVRALAGSARIDAGAPFNDLRAAAINVRPELARHLDEIGAVAERPAHITGSGSSIFVICDNSIHAAALADAIEERLDLPAVAVRST